MKKVLETILTIAIFPIILIISIAGGKFTNESSSHDGIRIKT